jgi:hypothetical protein
MPFELTMADGRDRGRRFRFDNDEVTIGRAPENDLVVHDLRASRSHARIRAGERGYALVDDGSCNGTHVNGRAAHGRTRLHEGDRIRIGSTTFEFSSASGRTGLARAMDAVRFTRSVVRSWPSWARAAALAGAVSTALIVSALASGARAAARTAAPSHGDAAGTDVAPASASPLPRIADELFPAATSELRAAREAYERGRRKLDERRIAPRNLYDAWRAFDAAAASAQGLMPPSAEAELRQLLRWAERELEAECRRLSFAAARFERYGEEARARATYREALLHFPGDDPSGCRKKAQQSLASADDGANPSVGVFGYADTR